MKRRICILLCLFLFFLAGCGKEKPHPLVGIWLHGADSEGYYTFREDGTGERTTYPEPRTVGGLDRAFTYIIRDNQLLLNYADGEQRTYVCGVSNDTLLLIDGMNSETFTRISGNETVIWKDLAGEYWRLFFLTMVPLYFMHLAMPYSYRYRPSPEEMPDKFFGTFSKGQLAQYLIQVPTLPLIILLGAALHEFAGLPGDLSVVLTVPLVSLWGLGPMELSRKIDGWK